MVDSCLENTDEEAQQACQRVLNDTEKLLYPPVTSNTTSLTYKNRFCAECNGEFDFYPWPIDIQCDLFLDINFFSSYDEVIEKGKENRCNIFPYPLEKELYKECILYESLAVKNIYMYFDSCNKTGSWEEIDDNIQLGCKSGYRNGDKLFINMFCKICNPSFHAGNMIDRCNVSGMWDIYNETYESACLNYEINMGTLPYKNIFCFSCNKPARNNYEFPEADMNIKRQTVKSSSGSVRFYFYIRIDNFNVESYSNLSTRMNTDKSTDDGRKGKNSYKPANITNIIHKKFALEGIEQTCGKYGIPDNFSTLRGNCSCDERCIFTAQETGKHCCADMPLLYPSQCLNEKMLSQETIQSTGEEFLVTNGCFRSGRFPEIIERGCLQQFEDAFSLHPVTDLSNGIPYLNMYCLLCNQPLLPTAVQHKPWDIVATCSVYIEHSNFFLFSEFLKTLRAAGCDTTYQPPSHPTGCRQNNKYNLKTCPRKSVTVKDKCNITGNWPKDDPDVRWACESTSTGALDRWSDTQNGVLTEYKNVFCALCNPLKWNDVLVENCSNDIDAIDADRCSFFPTIFIVHPYRNVFCRNCNGYMHHRQKQIVHHPFQLHTQLQPCYPTAPLQGYFSSKWELLVYNDVYMHPIESLQVTNYWRDGYLQTQILDPITVCV
jgi:hypothetical protein